MFPHSSQKRYWIFSDENDLTVFREKTNADFIERHGANMTVSRAEQFINFCSYLIEFQSYFLSRVPRSNNRTIILE